MEQKISTGVISCPLRRVPDTRAPGSCSAPCNESPPPNSPACFVLLTSFRFKPQGQARKAEPNRKGLRTAAATEPRPQTTRGATGPTPRVASATCGTYCPPPPPPPEPPQGAGLSHFTSQGVWHLWPGVCCTHADVARTQLGATRLCPLLPEPRCHPTSPPPPR